MLVLVCGDRNWKNWDLVISTLEGLDPDDTVMHGQAKGADTIAGIVWSGWGGKVEGHPARWELYGKAAGPIRNQEMLNRKPDKVIAFHNNIEESKGTKDMVERARKAGIPVTIISEGSQP